jgi:asparagine N-glycosylation enzyme membrane subunit Stt3
MAIRSAVSLHTTLKISVARVKRRARTMLWTIAVLLLILWLLGMVSSYTLGGFIHILLVLAIVAVLIRLIQGRNPVA